MYTMNCTYTVIIVAIIMITPCPCTYIGISITYSMWIFVTIIYAAFLPDTIILPRIFSHTHMMFFRRLFYHYCFEISWVNTRQGTNIYPQKWDFKDDFPNFPFGGISIRSLEGKNLDILEKTLHV